MTALIYEYLHSLLIFPCTVHVVIIAFFSLQILQSVWEHELGGPGAEPVLDEMHESTYAECSALKLQL